MHFWALYSSVDQPAFRRQLRYKVMRELKRVFVLKFLPANLIFTKSRGCRTRVETTPPLIPAIWKWLFQFLSVQYFQIIFYSQDAHTEHFSWSLWNCLDVSMPQPLRCPPAFRSRRPTACQKIRWWKMNLVSVDDFLYLFESEVARVQSAISHWLNQ